MEFNKENIGGLVLSYGDPKIVVGYDFINRRYIAEKITGGRYSTYTFVRECDIIKNSEMAINRKECNEKKISDISKLINIDDNICKRLNENELSEYSNLYSKLKDIYDNIQSINQLMRYRMNEEDKKFFIRELSKTRKGFRRRLKRLYRYSTKFEYQFINNIFNEYGVNTISYYKYKIDDLKNENKYIDVYLNKYEKIKYLLEEPLKIEIPSIKYIMDNIKNVINEAMVD